MSLLIQNGLVCLCAVGLALLFGLELGFCDHVPLAVFIFLSALVIALGATANLATVANTIAIEKDWVVVIANKNEDTLASEPCDAKHDVAPTHLLIFPISLSLMPSPSLIRSPSLSLSLSFSLPLSSLRFC